MKLRSGRSYGARAASGGLRNIVRDVAPYVLGAVATKLKSWFGGSQTITGTKKVSESGISTSQHDARTRYRYKRQPRRKRRAYVRKVRLFNHLLSKNQPLQSFTTKSVQNATAAVNKQITFGEMLYQTQPASSSNDLQQIMYDAYGVASLATIDQKWVIIKSAVMDVQVTNSASQGVIIDVYRIRLRNVWNTNDVLFTIWGTTFGDQNAISTKASDDPSVTPFQNPSFCKFFKVLDKREIMLGAGLTTTFQLRKAGDKWIQGRRVANEPLGIRGHCEGFLLQARGVPVTNAGPVYQLAAVNLTWSFQKTYSYALPAGSDASEAIHDV